MTDNDKPQKTKQPEDDQPAVDAPVPEAHPTPEAPAESNPEISEEEDFDFGGIPARNLKKNLGCGG